MKLCFLLAAVLFFIHTKSQTKLDGYVYDEITHKPLIGTRITLSIIDSIIYDSTALDSSILISNHYDTRYDTTYKELKKVVTDSNGYYLFENIPLSIYELSVFHVTNQTERNTLEGEFDLKKRIKTNDTSASTNSFVLHVTCEYDHTKNLTHCPKCKKADKVLLIAYGLFPPAMKPDPHYYYNGYCIIPRCHPTKHCIRCHVDF